MSMLKRGVQLAAIAGLGLLWVTAGEGENLKLKSVEVVGVGDAARVVLDVDGAVKHRSFTLPNPDRVVVDLVGVVNAVRGPVATPESGPVSRVRVSQFQGAPNPVVRVVADLRTKMPFEVELQDEDVVVVVGDAGSGSVVTPSAQASTGSDPLSDWAAFTPVSPVPASPGATAPQTTPETPSSVTPPASGPTVEPAAPVVGQIPPGAVVVPVVEATSPLTQAPAPAPAAPVETSVAVQSPPEPEPMLVDPLGPPVAHSFAEDTAPDAPPGGVEIRPVGPEKRINLDVQNADIHTVLRTLADYSGKNIIASREVEGEVTARLYDIPWQDALNSILRSHGFGYVEEHGILRVGVLQRLRSEELEEAAADRKREDLLPIETQVVKLAFADAEELKPSLADMMSPRGKLQVDARTNALIVSDIPAYVAKVAAMAGDLDGRTPQVEITSKLVDVSAEDQINLGIDWSGTNIQPQGAPIAINGRVNAPTTGAVGTLSIGTVQSWGQLSATIDALAKDKKANVVSNPNITTVNNREARILVGAKIPLIVADQAGNAITQLTKIGIQMSVVPHINSDKTITMDMHTEVSELSSQATVQGGVIIQTSEADTRVLVDSGETAIIGGLVRDVKAHTYTGIPVLQNLPLIGWFFRNTSTDNIKRELIIFVTPRLIEPGQKLRGGTSKG
jgi:hypothetical protein